MDLHPCWVARAFRSSRGSMCHIGQVRSHSAPESSLASTVKGGGKTAGSNDPSSPESSSSPRATTASVSGTDESCNDDDFFDF
eukprot:scaffold89842_cov51-Attheya_sp.AAC.1